MELVPEIEVKTPEIDVDAGVNDVDQEDYESTGSFFEVAPIVRDDINKKKLMKMKRTQMLNNDEHQLNYPICENMDRK